MECGNNFKRFKVQYVEGGVESRQDRTAQTSNGNPTGPQMEAASRNFSRATIPLWYAIHELDKVISCRPGLRSRNSSGAGGQIEPNKDR
jgi:hypothetical protein